MVGIDTITMITNSRAVAAKRATPKMTKMTRKNSSAVTAASGVPEPIACAWKSR